MQEAAMQNGTTVSEHSFNFDKIRDFAMKKAIENGYSVSDLSPENFDRVQCDKYNSSIGDLQGYDCKRCKNRGYFEKLDDNGFLVKVECRCMQIRRNVREMEEIGLGRDIRKCRFDSFITEQEFQKIMLSCALEYVKTDGNAWFWVAGQSGCGKTHLCTAICGQLLKQGRNIKYLLWGNVLQSLEATRFKADLREPIMRVLYDADVLYIDDFLKTPDDESRKPMKPSQSELQYAYTVINERYISGRKTIISSQHMLNELNSYDRATAGRISENSGKFTVNISRDETRNFRLKFTEVIQ